jgi:hypothetical protein
LVRPLCGGFAAQFRRILHNSYNLEVGRVPEDFELGSVRMRGSNLSDLEF